MRLIQDDERVGGEREERFVARVVLALVERNLGVRREEVVEALGQLPRLLHLVDGRGVLARRQVFELTSVLERDGVLAAEVVVGDEGERAGVTDVLQVTHHVFVKCALRGEEHRDETILARVGEDAGDDAALANAGLVGEDKAGAPLDVVDCERERVHLLAGEVARLLDHPGRRIEGPVNGHPRPDSADRRPAPQAPGRLDGSPRSDDLLERVPELLRHELVEAADSLLELVQRARRRITHVRRNERRHAARARCRRVLDLELARLLAGLDVLESLGVLDLLDVAQVLLRVPDKVGNRGAELLLRPMRRVDEVVGDGLDELIRLLDARPDGLGDALEDGRRLRVLLFVDRLDREEVLQLLGVSREIVAASFCGRRRRLGRKPELVLEHRGQVFVARDLYSSRGSFDRTRLIHAPRLSSVGGLAGRRIPLNGPLAGHSWSCSRTHRPRSDTRARPHSARSCGRS